ncbi:hypothetical protein ANN_03680 [Periplaneta americana]|uniref:Uncharacterized protein n=1 Tax=Periplaneta americana TaxID=6978 RepID=A0ABQ8U3E3_PERAM|nr:hypothetical protein ANN_03680 [Periplaneta americana]
MDLREVGYDDRDWINLAQDRDRWRAYYIAHGWETRAHKVQKNLEREKDGASRSSYKLFVVSLQKQFTATVRSGGSCSPGSSTESYPAFAHIGLRENSGKNLNQVTCPDRESNPGHLVSRPDALDVTPQVWTRLDLMFLIMPDRCKPIRMSIAMASIEKHVYYVIQLTTRSAVIVEESERCGGEAWEEDMILKDMLFELNDSCEQYEMKINANKTKTIVTGRKVKKVNLRILNEAVEQVDSFKYLECTISSNMRCSQEVKRRIAMAKEAFNRKRSIFCGPLEKELRKKLVNGLCAKQAFLLAKFFLYVFRCMKGTNGAYLTKDLGNRRIKEAIHSVPFKEEKTTSRHDGNGITVKEHW